MNDIINILFKIINKFSPNTCKSLLLKLRRGNQSNKILFVIEFPESFLNFQSLIEHFSEIKNNDLYIVTYKGYYADKFDSKFENLPMIQNATYIFKEQINNYKYDVIFLHNPYDLERDKSHSFYSLFLRANKMAYISYGIEIAGNRVLTQFNMPAQRYSDFVFVHSNSAKKQYEKYCKTGSEHVKITGHPFYDKIEPKITKSKYDFMLCIHHSIEKYDKDLSTYYKNIDLFLEFFKMNQQKTCLFRPHPMLFSKLKSISNSYKINQLIDLDNITLDKNENFIDSFHSSSALITDVGSFLMIYPFMNKPMGITVNPGNHLGDDGHLFESNLLKTKEELSSFLNYPFERRFIIDSSSLNIVTENITQNIYNSLCAE